MVAVERGRDLSAILIMSSMGEEIPNKESALPKYRALLLMFSSLQKPLEEEKRTFFA
jgi:hypothetical protein